MKTTHALLIVDVQQGFTPPIDFVKRLHKYSKRFPLRIFTRFVNPPNSMFRRVLKEESCAPGSPDTMLLIPKQKGDWVIDKCTYGLRPRELARMKRAGVVRCTVSGLDTDACVLGVMFSLFDAGIECHLKESMSFSTSGLHKPAMQIIRSQFPALR